MRIINYVSSPRVFVAKCQKYKKLFPKILHRCNVIVEVNNVYLVPLGELTSFIYSLPGFSDKQSNSHRSKKLKSKFLVGDIEMIFFFFKYTVSLS